MSSLLSSPESLTPFLSRYASQEKREKIFSLTQEIAQKIRAQLPIAFRYHDKNRLVVPTSLYLQNRTPKSYTKIRDPERGYPYTIGVGRTGALQTVAFDGLEEFPGKEGYSRWKSYHLEKIEDQRLMTFQEIQEHFPIIEQYPTYMEEPQGIVEGFVRNWNYWFRIFLAQAHSPYDLVPRSTPYDDGVPRDAYL